MLTKEQFAVALPKQFRGSLSQEVMDKINAAMSDPDMAEMMRDNLVGYTQVMNDGKFKLGNYVDAVRYVSYKLLGVTNLSAYIKTFPDKYQDFLSRGIENKDIASYISAYHKSKLVQLIMAQTMTPTYVLNADIYQEAINTQAMIMRNEDASYKVRSDAADSLLKHLTPPQESKIELEVGIKSDSVLTDLKDAVKDLVAKQREQIINGHASPKEIAEAVIIKPKEEA